jgi:hypothetical protein
MSTIIRPAPGIRRRIARASLLLALVLAGWFSIMLAMPFIGPAGRQVAVVGGEARAARAILASGGSIVEVRRGALIARSDRHGFVTSLYRNGAPLVLEGRIASGCFPAAGQ